MSFEGHNSPTITIDGSVELTITTGPGLVAYTCIVRTWFEASTLLQQWVGHQCRIGKLVHTRPAPSN